jgi:methyl-accepting chemotaxis protein
VIANDVRRTTMRSVLATEAADRAQRRPTHDKHMADLDAALADYQKLLSSDEEKRRFDDIKAAWSAYSAVDGNVLDLAAKGDAGFAEARALSNGESGVAFEKVLKLIGEDIALNRDGANAERAAAATEYRSAIMATGVLILISLVSGCGIAFVITRSISAPIRRAVAIAETVARGDLTAKIDASGKDETSQLLAALAHMNERPVDIVGRVRTSSENIATGSAQIASGNTDLSQRAEEQAASLEETAASMEQLTATVKQNAENAVQGNALAAAASETAVLGGAVVGRVVQTMQEISGSSNQVA